MNNGIILTTILIASSFLINCGGGESKKTPEPPRKASGFHYLFEGTRATIIDSSGNDFHGLPVLLKRVPGKVGNAVSFTGPGSVINLGGTLLNPFSLGFSFRAWIKSDTAITTQQQIMGYSSSNYADVRIALINDSLKVELPVGDAFIPFTTGPLNLPIASWYHIAITYDGNNLNFYYNGDLVKTDNILTTFSSGFSSQSIGNITNLNTANEKFSNQFIGYMDEFYLESRILTTTEISAYYLRTL